MKASIAMCLYNGKRFVIEQLDSIRKQSRQPYRLLICDDGSSDGGPEMVSQYIKENGLPKRFNTNENKQLIEDLENINDDYTPRFIIDSKKKGLFI